MKDIAKVRINARQSRRNSIRGKIKGTAERPRLCVRRSLRHLYAQLINDDLGVTLAFASSESKQISDSIKGKTKSEQAVLVGSLIAEMAKEKKIETIVFDRSGYLYHGRVKQFADTVREAGLKF